MPYPNESGVYLARTADSNWFNLLAEIEGFGPLVEIKWSLNRAHLGIPELLEHPPWRSIAEWGEKIC